MFVTKTGLQGHVVAPRREKVPSATKTSAAAATPPTATTVQHLQSSGKMNVSSCSDSSSLADGISSSAEAICEAAEAENNRKNSSTDSTRDGLPTSIIRHSTPSKTASKTGLRFIVADSEDEEAGIISEDEYSDLASGTSMNNLVEDQSSRSKCETTFSRTTFANNAGYPNCGTFFVQHISDDEAMFDNGNLSLQNNSLDENDNSSSAYASPNSIRKLVHGADQLVFIQNPSVDDSDVDYRPASEAEKPLKTKRSHSFHGSKSDVLLTSEDEMECDYNSHNASLKDADSLSQLVDSVVAEVHLLNEAITTDEDELLTAVFQPVEHRPHHHHHQHHPHQQHHQASVPKICVEDSEDHLRTTNEEEELSEYWDQEKYLSEHNYDEPIDVDSTLKLLNFGDDYSKFIDSLSDEISDLDQNTVKPQRIKRKVRRSTVKGSHYDSHSDSENDDNWKAVLLSRTKLNEVKQRLRNLEEEDQFTKNSVELTILKDVCYENIDCILKLLDESGAEGSTVLKKTERSFKGLLKQWQESLEMIVKRLQLSELHNKIMEEVNTFEINLDRMTSDLNQPQQLFHCKEDLEKHIQNLKTSLHHLSQHKTDLFHINVEIHNFLAELSCCPAVVFHTPPTSLGRKQQNQHQQHQLNQSHHRLPQLMMTGGSEATTNVMTSEAAQGLDPWFSMSMSTKKESPIVKGLKEKVVALYSNYDEAFHKTNTQLVNAQTTYANLLQFEIESKRLLGTNGKFVNDSTGRLLRQRKKKDSLSLTEDSGISESCDDSEEAILTKMKCLAQDLEQKLSLDSNLVQEITQTLKSSTSDLEERLHEKTCNRNCAGTQTIEFETFEVEPVKSSTTITKRMGWFKRLFWFALPVQFFLMVVLFLAWHSSDHHHGFYHFHGCDGSARFHFLYPQLKYINGPPPI